MKNVHSKSNILLLSYYCYHNVNVNNKIFKKNKYLLDIRSPSQLALLLFNKYVFIFYEQL